MSLLCLSKGVTAHAQYFDETDRPNSDLLILEIYANGYLRDEGIIAYLPLNETQGATLLPLSLLAELFSVRADIKVEEAIADGFYPDESNPFQIDINNKKAFIYGKDVALKKTDAEIWDGDMYVSADFLGKILNAEVRMDLSTLSLEVDSDEAFPFQAQLARRQKAEAHKNRGQSTRIAPEDAAFLPYQLISWPSLLSQQGVNAISSAGDVESQEFSTIQANMDLFYSNLNLTLSRQSELGKNTKITQLDLYFQRQDPAKDLLGIGAGTIEFGDINFPSVALFGSQTRGRGLSVSSNSGYSFEVDNTAEGFILEGEAPIGWDAELYRNGIYFGFQIIADTGRYLFEDLKLITGYNKFTIKLYGPEGQIQIIDREIYRGPTTLAKGELIYDLAVGQPGADFIPLAEGAAKADEPGLSSNFLYGLTEDLTIGNSSFIGKTDQEGPQDFASTTYIAGSFMQVNAQFQVMLGNRARRAYDMQLNRRFKKGNVSFRHTMYQGFALDDQDQKINSVLSLSTIYKTVNMDLAVNRTTFQQEPEEMTLTTNLAGKLGKVGFSNAFNLSLDSTNNTASGTLDFLTEWEDWRLRGGLNYDLSRDNDGDIFRSLQLTAQRSLANKDVVRLNSNYDFRSQRLAFGARYNRDFGPYSLDFNVGGDTEENYNAGITIRVALQPDHKGKYKKVDTQTGSRAFVPVRSFIDDNNDQIYNEGEEVIPDVTIQSSQAGLSAVTNEEGVASIVGLSEIPTRFYIDKESIPSIDITPAIKGLDVIPRRGADRVLDIPFSRLGEVEGFVYSEDDSSKPMVGIAIQIIKSDTKEVVDEMRSEYDGYFIFSGVPLGQYQLRLYEDAVPEDTQVIERLEEITLSIENALITDMEVLFPEIDFAAAPEQQEEFTDMAEDVSFDDESGEYYAVIGHFNDELGANNALSFFQSMMEEQPEALQTTIEGQETLDGPETYNLLVGPVFPEEASIICEMMGAQDMGSYCEIWPCSSINRCSSDKVF